MASRRKQLSGNRDRRKVECSACGAGGHVAAECRGTVRCRNCRQAGHVAKRCSKNGQTGVVAGARQPQRIVRHRVEVDGRKVQAMVDTGSSLSLVDKRLIADDRRLDKSRAAIVTMMNGQCMTTMGTAWCKVRIDGVVDTPVEVHVAESLPMDVAMVLGLDLISQTKGVRLSAARDGDDWHVVFGGSSVVTKPLKKTLEADDYEVEFDGRHWTMKWRWADGPPDCQNSSNYHVAAEHREEFEAEVQSWIDEGILVAWDPAIHGEVKALIPLMARSQPKKKKVRPVLDYRQLNEFILSRPGTETQVCEEEMRAWRRVVGDFAIVDLKRAYLQIRVDPSLWVYQGVRFQGKVFLLTRMGFGLSVGPKVMPAIVKWVLARDEAIQKVTGSYIDDIHVDESHGVLAEDVVRLLNEYGLACKAPERVRSGTSVHVLGLRVMRTLTGELWWSRDGDAPARPSGMMTRR